MPIFTTDLSTPVGDMVAGVTDEGLCLLDFRHRKMLPAIKRRVSAGLGEEFVEGRHPLLEQLETELYEYFAGVRRQFSIALRPVGSEFQQGIWAALQHIPYGTVRTYMQQARAYGDEKAVRAVATANGMNGIAIIIPCHRVVGSNGALTGYAGGLRAKRWLIDHERRNEGGELQGALFEY